VVIEGATGTVTVSVAEELVMLPETFVTFTENVAPLSEAFVAGVV
jgi:hypothetical protein